MRAARFSAASAPEMGGAEEPDIAIDAVTSREVTWRGRFCASCAQAVRPPRVAFFCTRLNTRHRSSPASAMRRDVSSGSGVIGVSGRRAASPKERRSSRGRVAPCHTSAASSARRASSSTS
jgi:hypothetical protein